MNKRWLVFGTLLLTCLSSSVLCAEAPAKGSDKAPMGSPEFYPSPERPYGWRGDWTGRFPGATPPTQWSRRVKGIASQLRCQAKKPADEPDADARPVEYFTLRDWLVAGPFSVKDPAKDIEKDFLGGEAAVMPDEGAKAAEGVAWKATRTNMDSTFMNDGHLFLDFVFQYGKRREEKGLACGGSQPSINPPEGWEIDYEGDFSNKLAYAHTYVYAPQAGAANLHVVFSGKECRTWLNGTQVKLDGKGVRGIPVNLIKGWNRLLIKVSCVEGKKKAWNHWVSGWQCAAYLSPVAPVQYETSNIKWMTPLAGHSASQPVMVGKYFYIGMNSTDLACMEKETGKIRWLRTITTWDALNAEDKAKYKETMEPLIAQLAKINEGFVAAINESVSPVGMSEEQAAALNAKLKAKNALEKNIHQALHKLDSRYPTLLGNEYSSNSATPVSDGKNVYWVCGGAGSSGPSTVICAFDLAGNLVWSRQESFSRIGHGSHVSPALAHGKLVYGAGIGIIALDATTGDVAWRQKAPSPICFSSPVIAHIGNEPVVAFKPDALLIYRLADGQAITSDRQRYEGERQITLVIENGVIYLPNRPRVMGTHGYAGMHGLSAAAFKLPSDVNSTNIVPQPFMVVAQVAGGVSYFISAPLLVGDALYTIDITGYFAVYDMKAGEVLHHCYPDWHNWCSRFLYGVCASPTLAGNYIYLVSGAGETLVLKNGPKYDVIARNVLEDINPYEPVNNPCNQDMFLTAPVFEGPTMYLRGRQYFYCIQETGK